MEAFEITQDLVDHAEKEMAAWEHAFWTARGMGYGYSEASVFAYSVIARMEEHGSL